MAIRKEQLKNLKSKGIKKEKQIDLQSVKSKFDLTSLLILPITTAFLFIFNKDDMTEDTVKTIFSALLLTFIGRTLLMYYSNSKNKVAQKKQFYTITNSLVISLVFAFVMLIFCLLVKVSLKNQFFELLCCSLYVSNLGMYPAAFVVGTDFEVWTKMFSPIEIFKLNRDEISVGAPLLGTVIGAWLSVLAIPLDWQQWWQPFPISTVLFSVLGNLVGSVIGILFYFIKKDTVPVSVNKAAFPGQTSPQVKKVE